MDFDFDGMIQFVSYPLLVLFTALIVLEFPSLFFFLLTMILAPAFYLEPKQMELLGFVFEKTKDKKWKYSKFKFAFGFCAYFNFKLDKFKDLPVEQFKKKEKAHLLLASSINVLIGAGVFAGSIFLSKNVESKFWSFEIFVIGLEWLLFAVMKLCTSLYIVVKINSKNSLTGYYHSKVQLIRAKVPVEQLDMKSVRELDFKQVKNFEKVMYFPLYFEYLEALELYDRMPEAVADVEPALKPELSTRPEVIAACFLVLYYSCYCLNTPMAMGYYQKTGGILEKDPDSNSLRIVAYYELNCMGNLARAKELYDQAESMIDDFSTGSERDYGRRMLAKLKEDIEHFQPQMVMPPQTYL